VRGLPGEPFEVSNDNSHGASDRIGRHDQAVNPPEFLGVVDAYDHGHCDLHLNAPRLRHASKPNHDGWCFVFHRAEDPNVVDETRPLRHLDVVLGGSQGGQMEQSVFVAVVEGTEGPKGGEAPTLRRLFSQVRLVVLDSCSCRGTQVGYTPLDVVVGPGAPGVADWEGRYLSGGGRILSAETDRQRVHRVVEGGTVAVEHVPEQNAPPLGWDWLSDIKADEAAYAFGIALIWMRGEEPVRLGFAFHPSQDFAAQGAKMVVTPSELGPYPREVSLHRLALEAHGRRTNPADTTSRGRAGGHTHSDTRAGAS